jgi:hypothetical protein
MSKRLLVTLVAVLAGLLMASSAMADLGEESYATLQHATTKSGNFAGIILNPEGKGDVLIFPYYDVREIFGKAQDFYFYIICSNDWDPAEDKALSTEAYDGNAMKLRFREWDKSEEVFDVDIWCSRGDVWVGQVTHNTTIALPYGARIYSPDYVIIASDSANFTLDKPLAAGFDFPQTAFIPPGSSNLYGYIEVIGEERTYDHIWTTSPAVKVHRINTSPLDENNGVCTSDANPGASPNCKADVANELVGFAYLIRVADGQAMAYNATAIANFMDTNNVTSFASLFSSPGGVLPQLTEAEDGLDALEFQLSKESIWAAYSVESVINGNFSLIATFPTKHYHFCVKPNYTAPDAASAPSKNCGNVSRTPPWTITDSIIGDHNANTPEAVNISIWDRNENTVTPPRCFVSPCPQGFTGLPYEVNVIGLFQGSIPSLPAVNNRNNVGFSTGTFDSGWVKIEFPNGYCRASGMFFNFGTFYWCYEGLPVIALSLQEYSNGAVGGWYGDIRPAWYETEWDVRCYPGGQNCIKALGDN